MRWVATSRPRTSLPGPWTRCATAPRLPACFWSVDQDRVEAELRRLQARDPRLEVVHASEVIEMHDPPVQSVRRKKDSSMCRAIDLVKQGEADAIVSAGNTGALLTASHLKLRTLEGVDRPGLAVFDSRAPTTCLC